MTDIGDPYILKVEDTYYMYATSVAHAGFKVWESTDMAEWKDAGMAYDHREHEEKWAKNDFWAPKVIPNTTARFIWSTAREPTQEV